LRQSQDLHAQSLFSLQTMHGIAALTTLPWVNSCGAGRASDGIIHPAKNMVRSVHQSEKMRKQPSSMETKYEKQ